MANQFESAVRDWTKTLDRFSDDAVRIAAAGVGAAVNVLEGAAEAAAIGGIKKEVGGYVRIQGTTVFGRAGLMVFPSPDGGLVKGLRPHGVYLDYGTKYISARHTIARALQAARARASGAMRRATERKIKQLKGTR